MIKRSVLKLGLVLPVLVLCIGVLTTTALADGGPIFISGHVTVNGAATSGVSISAGNSHATTDGSGFYQLSPSVSNGSSVTVTATYQGHSQSKTITQNMQGSATADFAISYAVPSATATATATATPTPTSPPSSGGSGGSTHGGGGVPATGSAGYASQDAPKPVANNTTSAIVTATVLPTAAPTAAPTVAPTPTPTPTTIPTVTAEASPVSELNNSFDWWIAAMLAALAAIVGTIYYFISGKR